MARPKEKINSAFQQKCTAASDKLQTLQANSLIRDIGRLQSDELLTDINIVIGHRHIKVHGCILDARCPAFYEYLQSLPKTSDGDIVLDVQSQSNNIEKLFSDLYTTQDVTETLIKLEQCLFPSEFPVENDFDSQVSHDLEVSLDLQGSHDFDRSIISSETINVISENITNTSLDLVKRDSRNIVRQQTNQRPAVNDKLNDSCMDEEPVKNSSSTLNGFVKDDTNSQIYALAERVVQQVITEAKSIVNNDNKRNESFQNSQDIGQDLVVKDENMVAMVMCNDGTKCSDNCDNQNLPCKEPGTNSDICKSTKTISSKDQKSGCRFTISKKKSYNMSLQKLAEERYSMKTLIRPCNKLGEDLLKMLFLEENCDFFIKVSDQRFFTHRCILAARSSYFEAILCGSWRETDESCITLEGVSVGVLKQTLLYLYGGVIDLQPTCSLGGLVMMADMYGMDGLKDIIALHLNMEYCHFFHRPCSVCIASVPEALALTLMYNIDTMKDKCLKWINKNFGKVWPTKSFVSLPAEVLDISVSGAIKDLALDNVLDTLVECQKLNEKTPHLKWTEPVFDMVTQLMDAAIEFSSKNFISLVSRRNFRKIDKDGIAFNHQPLEDIFGMIIQALSPENACQAYLSLHKWKKTVEIQEQSEYSDYSKEFVDFVNVLFMKCKEHLCVYVHQAVYTTEWELLNKDMQKEIMQDANYVCLDYNKGRMAKPKLTSMQPKKVLSTTPMSLKEYFECHFGYPKQPVSKTKTDVKSKTSKCKPAAKKVTVGVKEKPTEKRSQNLTLSSKPGIKKKNPSSGIVVMSTCGTGKNDSFQRTGKTKHDTSASSELVLVDTNIKSDLTTGSDGKSVNVVCEVNVEHESQCEDGCPVLHDDIDDDVLVFNFDDIDLVDLPPAVNFPADILVPILQVNFNEVQ